MKEEKIIIVGAGIVGLATAYQLLKLKPGLQICILEKESGVSKHQSGNNSGVIHSGIYYKPGSLRAQNCKRGYSMLLDFAMENNVPFEICGKIIVATRSHQLENLQNIYERGLGNGLQGVALKNIDELKEIEPHVQGLKGIWVPQGGICDYKEISLRLKEKIENSGGRIFFNEKVKSIHIQNNLVSIDTEFKSFQCELLINCGGLYSDVLAKLSGQKINMQILPFRGEYYTVKSEKKYLVKNLIYPAPDPNFPFLGVHFTRMINGELEAGPNAVLAFRREGYKMSDIKFSELWETISYKGFRRLASKFWKQGMEEYKRSLFKSIFTKSLQELIPEIAAADLEVGGAGVRAAACDENGNLVDDFVFLEDQRVINVCNAPSPAATSSLSIGLTIAEMALKKIS